MIYKPNSLYVFFNFKINKDNEKQRAVAVWEESGAMTTKHMWDMGKKNL